MIHNHKISKAFTLAEIFITMVVLSVLVSVCLSFFVQRHDYKREYFYYAAYKNVVNVVESALFKDEYLKTSPKRIEKSTCGLSTAPKQCRIFSGTTTATNICSIFKDYFNTVSDSCGTNFAAGNSDTPSLKLTNGMMFYFSNPNAPSTAIAPLADASVTNNDKQGYTLWIDLDGHGQGEDKENYDIMKFYITRSGKVIPAYGTVSGIRGYDFVPAEQDAAGNAGLIAFDIIRKTADSNLTSVLPNYHSVPFPVAACVSGYIGVTTPYCTGFKTYNASTNEWEANKLTKSADCNAAVADCQIRLVKKLKRTK